MKITRKQLKQYLRILIAENDQSNEGLSNLGDAETVFKNDIDITGASSALIKWINDSSVDVHQIPENHPWYSFVLQTRNSISTGGVGEEILRHAYGEEKLLNTNAVSNLTEFKELGFRFDISPGAAGATESLTLGGISKGQFPGIDCVLGAHDISEVFEAVRNQDGTVSISVKPGIKFLSAKESSGMINYYTEGKGADLDAKIQSKRYAPTPSFQPHKLEEGKVRDGLTAMAAFWAVKNGGVDSVDIARANAANPKISDILNVLYENGYSSITGAYVSGASLTLLPTIPGDLDPEQQISDKYHVIATVAEIDEPITGVSIDTKTGTISKLSGEFGKTKKGAAVHSNVKAFYSFGSVDKVLRQGANVKNAIGSIQNGVESLSIFLHDIADSIMAFDEIVQSAKNNFMLDGQKLSSIDNKFKKYNIELVVMQNLYRSLEAHFDVAFQSLTAAERALSGGGSVGNPLGSDEFKDYLIDFLKSDASDISTMCDKILAEIELSYSDYGHEYAYREPRVDLPEYVADWKPDALTQIATVKQGVENLKLSSDQMIYFIDKIAEIVMRAPDRLFESTALSENSSGITISALEKTSKFLKLIHDYVSKLNSFLRSSTFLLEDTLDPESLEQDNIIQLFPQDSSPHSQDIEDDYPDEDQEVATAKVAAESKLYESVIQELINYTQPKKKMKITRRTLRRMLKEAIKYNPSTPS